jgi:CheY-like chemotaxis protein
MPGRRVSHARVQARRVLLIDDDPHFASQIKTLLEKEGFVVEVLSDHSQADAKLAQVPHVLVVSDDNIDHMQGFSDGEQWCKKYKQSGGKVPVLILTGAEIAGIKSIKAQGEALFNMRQQSQADFVMPKSVIQDPNGEALFLRYVKDLALHTGSARSIDSNYRG